MELKVVIDKKFAFMILGAILVLAGAIYGYAHGGSTPSVMGHSFEEVEGVQARVSGSCSAGSSIRAIGADGGITCEIDNSGGSSTCQWVNDNSACDGNEDTISCASNEYVRKVRTKPSCHIGDSSWRTKVDLYCCEFS